ncbi:response regulator [Leptolyngbya ohadii]|uniref:response regulator n=1 Tax=Leptolyngbya ohadii TaxID=1962290 RepID=UPI000B59CF6C|nr:response regulator [Leptolyngbya ohadii]
MKILVVEDDRAVAQSLQLLLNQYNYAVDIAVDGEAALQMADAFDYHLVLLDFLLPRLDGIEVCRQLRKKGFRQPILLLTGQGKAQQKANTSWSVATALNTGADDYVRKPFDKDELIARIQALLRRGASAGEPILNWEYLSFDPNTRRVAYRNQLVFLTPKEYAILELFLRHQETVFSARAILDQAWSSVESPGEEAVRCHLKELRQKLAAAGAPKDLIKTVYRVGYRLNPLYSSFSAGQSEECLNPAQVAELKAVNEQLRLTLEELQTAEEELKQKNERLTDTQRLLELEQQHYHDLFEFAPDAYLVTDTEGVIQAANQAASDLFQVESQALVGKPLTVFIAKSDLRDFCLQLNALNFVQNWEVQINSREGNPLPVLITVTTIKNLQKEITGLRWLLRDIRLRKQVEQQLQAAHAELEQRVADRTAELSQREAFLSSFYDGTLTTLPPLRDSQGRIDRLVGTVPDLSERMRVEDEIELVCEVSNRIVPQFESAYTEVALHHNQEMFSELIRNAPFGIYLVDAEFRLQQINQKAEAIFANIDPLIGRDLGEILRIVLQEPSATEAIHHFQHTLASGEPYYSPIIVEPRANIEEIQAYDWQIHRITLPDSSYGVVCYFYDLSEIRRAEAALHESEQLLQLAMAGAQAGSWDWVMATGQLSWSPETYQLYGLAATSSPPKYDDWYKNILHPDDRPWVNQYVNQAIIQHQTDIQLEFRILHPQHGIRWIMSLGHLTVNDQGEPVRLSGINLDISDRKQAELTLQKQIQQEYLLNEIAQEIRCSLNLQEVLSSTVQRVRTFLGVDRVVIFRFRPDWQGDVITESVGAEWTPILSTTISDPCFRDRYLEPYHQGRVAAMSDIDAANLEPCYVELLQRFQVKANLIAPILQNNHLWGLLIVHQCAAPRQWHSVEVAAIQRLATQVGIAIQQAELYQQLQLELSDRKQAEQKIREQAALLDVATDAILVRDLDHHILYWNQGAERLYGWTAEEALAQKANELLSVTPAGIAKVMQTVLEQGEWHGEIHKVTKTGKPVIVEGRWTLVRDEAGQPKSVLIVDTDITEKKSLESQFYQAQRLESLGTLTSGIAHDLNNALTPILTIAQLLRMQQHEMDARSQEMLQVLEDSARRGADLVQQILTFTRGTGGERTPVEVVPLLQEVVKVTQQTFPKFITIRETVAAQPVSPVSANTTQLHQILMNLCVNARDAMPNGGTLTLSAENFEVNEVFAQMNLDARMGQYVLITVADTGTGMVPEVRDRIFDPFFTTKPLGQGTGLGLSTVLGIVRSYGGFIRVASEVGKGTQFKVYLPVVETEAASDLRETTLLMGQGELILAVDDEDSILQSTRAILETHHYRVLTANSGADAIATYAQHQQDIALVLVDMMMPDMNGITIIQVLQEMNPDIKAIAASGLMPQYQQSLESLGITTCINKPYTTEELLNSIHRHLNSTPSILEN